VIYAGIARTHLEHYVSNEIDLTVLCIVRTRTKSISVPPFVISLGGKNAQENGTVVVLEDWNRL